MVWFQCEDCGENLKKPKLANHFRICSAFKLSCIDCGEIFGQQSVQSHTQCITEAEKYGPKGQGKAINGSNAKPNKETKQHPEIDINVGLSERPPWFCSLCNTKATSKQTLLLHADGKKHRAKARAFHAKQQPKQVEESAPNSNASTDNTSKTELVDNKSAEGQKVQDLPKGDDLHANLETANGDLLSKKKRKLNASEKDEAGKNAGDDLAGETGNGEVIQVVKEQSKRTRSKVLKKAKKDVLNEDKVESGSTKEPADGKIKWKKLIISALKSNPDGVLKMKKLRKLILKSLCESGIEEDETKLNDELEKKITSSSRFAVDNKYVRLVAKD